VERAKANPFPQAEDVKKSWASAKKQGRKKRGNQKKKTDEAVRRKKKKKGRSLRKKEPSQNGNGAHKENKSCGVGNEIPETTKMKKLLSFARVGEYS